MEHFEQGTQKPVKEKSVYLLHLDTPRIIIIVSVVIGIMIVTFLVGMHFTGDSKSSNMASQEESLLPPGLGDGSMNALQGESSLLDTSSNPLILDQDKENLLMPGNDSEKDATGTMKGEKDIADSKAGTGTDESEDVLNREVIEKVVPPKKIEKAEKSTPKKKSSNVARAKKSKPEPKKKVVEVSSSHKKPRHTVVPKGQYVIQVASFDTSTKAGKEVNRLKRLRFDAFVDRARVNGKTFYRVRIGPIPSKVRAISMLNDIQDIERYRTSYMVQE